MYWVLLAVAIICLIVGSALLGVYVPQLYTNSTIVTPSPTITPTITPTPTVTPPAHNEVSIMTYNILNAAVCQNTAYSWANRRSQLVANIQSVTPDLFALQEATQATLGQSLSAVQYILANLPGYAYIPGLARGDGTGECVPIYYNTARVALVANSTVEAKYSQHDSSCSPPDEDFARTYTYAEFKMVSSGTNVIFLGTHMPRKDCQTLQMQDANELKSVIEAFTPGVPYFVVADWNNGGAFKANEYLTANVTGLTSATNGGTHYDLNKNSCTFNNLNAGGALDRILSTQTNVHDLLVLPGNFNLSGTTVPTSDHAAVYGTYSL